MMHCNELPGGVLKNTKTRWETADPCGFWFSKEAKEELMLSNYRIFTQNKAREMPTQKKFKMHINSNNYWRHLIWVKIEDAF